MIKQKCYGNRSVTKCNIQIAGAAVSLMGVKSVTVYRYEWSIVLMQ